VAAATRENVSPSVILELLRRIGGIIRDYCGVLSEEAVRKNCVLVYELLDEVSLGLCMRNLCVTHTQQSSVKYGIASHRSATSLTCTA
jgi:hypothetical protein